MKELLHKIQYGNDQLAFNALYEHFSYRLFLFAFSLLKSREPSEEVVNDAFLNCWNNRHRLHEIGNFTVYIYVAVKNLALNRLKQEERHRALLWDALATYRVQVTPSPEQLMMSGELVKRIEQAVSQLPPKCKLIFMLVKEDGLKHHEVAEILGLSLNTVEKQVSIALKKIAQELQLSRNGKPAVSPAPAR